MRARDDNHTTITLNVQFPCQCFIMDDQERRHVTRTGGIYPIIIWPSLFLWRI